MHAAEGATEVGWAAAAAAAFPPDFHVVSPAEATGVEHHAVK
jgi:hypothetical protein